MFLRVRYLLKALCHFSPLRTKTAYIAGYLLCVDHLYWVCQDHIWVVSQCNEWYIYLAKPKSGAPIFFVAFIEICLAYERNNVTTSSFFLQLYIFLVHMQQKLSINNNNNNVIQRAKLHTPDNSSGEDTRSRLAEHASSTFRWFLHFVSKNNEFFQVLWSSTV